MGMIIMQLKRKIGLIAAGLITLSGVSIIEEIYVYGNEKNKSNIQLEEYEIKDLANLIGKNKIDVENVLGKGYEKEILHTDVLGEPRLDGNGLRRQGEDQGEAPCGYRGRKGAEGSGRLRKGERSGNG